MQDDKSQRVVVTICGTHTDTQTDSFTPLILLLVELKISKSKRAGSPA